MALIKKNKSASVPTEKPTMQEPEKSCNANITQNPKIHKDGRYRNWTIIVYPESAPENWRNVLDEEHMEWIESPLHDKDKNADGSAKKPHWHIALLFDGKKSYEQIKEIADKINSPSPKYIQSARAMIRYFAHLDNPEKYQYPVSEIIAHGGADLVELLKPISSSRYEMIKDMIAYIRKNHVTEFIDFLVECSENHYEDWFPLLCDSASFVIGNAIKSNRHKPTLVDISALTEKAENPRKM